MRYRIRGLEPPVLIVTQSIIVAGLLAWAQLWGHTYDVYIKEGDPVWHVSLTLGVLYTAVVAAIASIVFNLCVLIKVRGHLLPTLAAAFSGFSFTLLTVVVLASTPNLYWEAWQGLTQWHPSPIVLALDPRATTLVAMISSPVVLGIWCFISWFWLTEQVCSDNSQ